MTLEALILLHVADKTPFGELTRWLCLNYTPQAPKSEIQRWAKIMRPLALIHEWGLAEEYQFAHSNRHRFQVIDDVLYDLKHLTFEGEYITDGFYIYDTWKDLARMLGVWSGRPDLDADVVTTLYFGDERDELPFTVDDLRAQRLEAEACDPSENYTRKYESYWYAPPETNEEVKTNEQCLEGSPTY